MKFKITVFLIALTVIIGCEKGEEYTDSIRSQENVENITKRGLQGWSVVTMRGKPDHRLSYSYGIGRCNMRMNGICMVSVLNLENIHLDEIDLLDNLGLQGGVISPILVDDHGEPYIEVPVLDGNVIFEDDEKKLYIDLDIFSEGNRDFTFKINSGIYSIDMGIGQYGGYKLPLEII